jgi:hypothetical protein
MTLGFFGIPPQFLFIVSCCHYYVNEENKIRMYVCMYVCLYDRNCFDPCVFDVIPSTPPHRREGACNGHVPSAGASLSMAV